MSDDKLAEQVADYAQLARENKNVDVTALMMSALQNDHADKVSGKAKKIAYLVSIGVPPLGALWAIYYFLSDKDDAKEVAYVCLVLTVFAVAIFLVSAKLFFSSSGTSVQQIEQINPQMIHNTLGN